VQIRLGVIPVVLRALTAHRYDPVVQAYGLGVLRNLSFLEANRSVVGQSGALELAVAALCAHLANADGMAPHSPILPCERHRDEWLDAMLQW
jgi:hypothetical protein